MLLKSDDSLGNNLYCHKLTIACIFSQLIWPCVSPCKIGSLEIPNLFVGPHLSQGDNGSTPIPSIYGKENETRPAQKSFSKDRKGLE